MGQAMEPVGALEQLQGLRVVYVKTTEAKPWLWVGGVTAGFQNP